MTHPILKSNTSFALKQLALAFVLIVVHEKRCGQTYVLAFHLNNTDSVFHLYWLISRTIGFNPLSSQCFGTDIVYNIPFLNSPLLTLEIIKNLKFKLLRKNSTLDFWYFFICFCHVVPHIKNNFYILGFQTFSF